MNVLEEKYILPVERIVVRVTEENLNPEEEDGDNLQEWLYSYGFDSYLHCNGERQVFKFASDADKRMDMISFSYERGDFYEENMLGKVERSANIGDALVVEGTGSIRVIPEAEFNATATKVGI